MAPRVATTKVPTTLVSVLARIAGTVDGYETAGALDQVPDAVRKVLLDLRSEYDAWTRVEAATTDGETPAKSK